MRPLLSFVAIEKNEAANFRATLESVKPFVDYWTVVDTGSSDGTQDLVREVMGDVPGQLIEEPFVDFASTRNRALDADAASACPCVFTLMLSGDEVLVGGDKLRSFLEEARELHSNAGAFNVTVQSGSRQWSYPRVLRTDHGWRYKRPIHELPVGPGGETEALLIPDVRVIHSPSTEDQERKKRRILDFDLPTLTKLVEDESKPLVDRTGDIWYLAETHANIAAFLPKPDGKRGVHGGPWLSHVMAAAALYFRHADLVDNIEVAARSLVLHYRMLSNADVLSDAEMIPRMEHIIQAAPTMPEARLQLAMHAARVDARRGRLLAMEAVRVAREGKNTALHMDCEWQALRIAAGCAMVLGHEEQARKLAAEAVAAGARPDVMEEIFR